VQLVVVEVVVAVVLAVLDAFLGVPVAFLDVIDGSVLAFLSSCWLFVVVVAFEQQPRHQQTGDSEEYSFLVPD
jgi:F0F1-type ATP synthase assembly protein I